MAITPQQLGIGIGRRFTATRGTTRWIKLVEAVSWSSRTRYHSGIRRLLDTDRSVRRFVDGETDRLPDYYHTRIKQELGPMYGMLPEGALKHDHTAYLKTAPAPVTVGIQRKPARPLTPRRGDEIQPTM